MTRIFSKYLLSNRGFVEVSDESCDIKNQNKTNRQDTEKSCWNLQIKVENETKPCNTSHLLNQWYNGANGHLGGKCCYGENYLSL